MFYIEKTLLQDEQIILATRPHWIIFLPSMVLLLVTVLFLWLGPYIGLTGFPIYYLEVYEWLALFTFIFGLYSLLKAYVLYRTSEYGITDKRVLMKTGFIQRNSLEIFLDKIEGVLVDQTVVGRILNYGTLIIIGTGGTRDPFFNVPNPLSFRKTVQQQIDLAKKVS